MKEIVVASGKGGVGKTTVASSLAVYLAKNGKRVYTADVDVDAPDLLLALGGGKETLFSMEVQASKKAKVDQEKCVGCWMCVMVCPFGVIRPSLLPGKKEKVAVRCDLCQDRETPACVEACPTGALFFGEIEDFKKAVSRARRRENALFNSG